MGKFIGTISLGDNLAHQSTFKICLTFNSMIPHLVVNPREIPTHVHKEIHIRKFTTAFFEQ